MAESDYMVLRGARDYLHGASIFSYFQEAAGKATGQPGLTAIDLVIAHSTRNQAELVDFKAADRRPLVATFRSAEYTGKLVETVRGVGYRFKSTS